MEPLPKPQPPANAQRRFPDPAWLDPRPCRRTPQPSQYVSSYLKTKKVFEGLPEGFCEDQDTVVRYMKLLPPVFSDEDRRAEAATVSLLGFEQGFFSRVVRRERVHNSDTVGPSAQQRPLSTIEDIRKRHVGAQNENVIGSCVGAPFLPF